MSLKDIIRKYEREEVNSDLVKLVKLLNLSDVERVKGKKGEKGDPGKTPVKGVDYLTEKEKREFEKEIERDIKPVKGKDYFTPKEVDDIVRKVKPKKGKDYFTTEEIEDIRARVTPVKGKDYRDGVDGKTIVKKEKDITGKELVKRIESLEGEDRLDIEKLKNLHKIVQWARSGIGGGGDISDLIHIGTTAPNNPQTNDLWIDTSV